MIAVAQKAGADAIKFQSFSADRLVTRGAPVAEYQRDRFVRTQYEMLSAVEISGEGHRELVNYSREVGIVFLSSTFDEQSVDLLESMGVEAFKIPSGEITNLSLLRYVASKGKPILLSTGMSDLGEVESAIRAIEEAGNHRIVLLHCVSSYPPLISEVNLRVMHTLSTAFGYPTGYSDHTEGIDISLASVAIGANVLEKHFTLSRNLPGPDQRVSVEPNELKAMVEGVRRIEAALGDGKKISSPTEKKNAAVARKSLVAAMDIPEGSCLSSGMVTLQRPGTGLPPGSLRYLLGRRTKFPLKQGQLLQLDAFH